MFYRVGFTLYILVICAQDHLCTVTKFEDFLLYQAIPANADQLKLLYSMKSGNSRMLFFRGINLVGNRTEFLATKAAIKKWKPKLKQHKLKLYRSKDTVLISMKNRTLPRRERDGKESEATPDQNSTEVKPEEPIKVCPTVQFLYPLSDSILSLYTGIFYKLVVKTKGTEKYLAADGKIDCNQNLIPSLRTEEDLRTHYWLLEFAEDDKVFIRNKYYPDKVLFMESYENDTDKMYKLVIPMNIQKSEKCHSDPAALECRFSLTKKSTNQSSFFIKTGDTYLKQYNDTLYGKILIGVSESNASKFNFEFEGVNLYERYLKVDLEPTSKGLDGGKTLLYDGRTVDGNTNGQRTFKVTAEVEVSDKVTVIHNRMIRDSEKETKRIRYPELPIPGFEGVISAVTSSLPTASKGKLSESVHESEHETSTERVKTLTVEYKIVVPGFTGIQYAAMIKVSENNVGKYTVDTQNHAEAQSICVIKEPGNDDILGVATRRLPVSVLEELLEAGCFGENYEGDTVEYNDKSNSILFTRSGTYKANMATGLFIKVIDLPGGDIDNEIDFCEEETT